MSITRRDFLEYVVATATIGCSGEFGSSPPAVVPSAPTPTSTGNQAGAMAGAAGRSAEAIAHLNASAGTAGMGAVDVGRVTTGGTMSSAAVEGSAAVRTVAKLGGIRGRIATRPAAATKHAVIYLVNGPIERVVDVKIDDQKLNFFPHVAVMTVGGTLTYVNHHPFPDSAFSGSNNDKWDFGMVEAHGVRKRKFEKPGHYTLLCHIHPNQVGFLIVAPSSYFAQVDKEGNYLLSNVPAGNYDLVAWAPRMQPETRAISVTDSEATADFELKR